MVEERLLGVSVDLDAVGCYHAIHGLEAPIVAVRDVHYSRGLRRFLDLFEEVGVRATLFAVGEDLGHPVPREVLREACDRGHEAANHTQNHPYAFTRLDDDALRREVHLAGEAIERVSGARTVGFRAPGYHIDDRIPRILVDEGYRYDASLLPSPMYYAAKVGAMGLMRLRGRSSRSIAGHPGMVLAPNRPYRMGRSYWRRGDGLVEMPCTVIPHARVPFIGTSLALAGPRMARWMARSLTGASFVGLEFHALDLMDAEGDGLDLLARHQPDLRVLAERKRLVFLSVLTTFLEAGFRSVTLASAVRRLFG